MLKKRQLVCLPALWLLAVFTGQGSTYVQAAPLPGPSDPQAATTPILANADASLARMDASRLRVRDLLAKARAQRDTILTICVSDKLTQMDVAMRAANEQRAMLAASVSEHTEDVTSINRINSLELRTKRLVRDASQCIGNTTTATLVGSPAEEDTASSNDAIKGAEWSFDIGPSWLHWHTKEWWQDDPPMPPVTDPPKPASPTK